MMCEPHEAELSRSTQLSMLLQASLSIEDLRLVTAERAQKFENNYRKDGSYRLPCHCDHPSDLPDSDVQSRIKDRVPDFVDYLYYRNLCMADCYRIYHTKLEEQKEMAGMSYEEMLENFRGKEAE